jgi:uncharacterized protein (TIGR03086 family)
MPYPANSAMLMAGAIHYALGSLSSVRPGFLSRPTPCAAWNLVTLLEHVNDSLAALHEGIGTGHVGLAPTASPAGDPAGGLVAVVRDQAARLLAASATASYSDIAIADRCLAGSVVAAVGAVEIAAHGWDVAEACGGHRPIPAALAEGIMELVPLVVTDATRDDRFAAPVAVSPLASPGDRLVALLGRRPSAHDAVPGGPPGNRAPPGGHPGGP